jgi:colicin import membrane protein
LASVLALGFVIAVPVAAAPNALQRAQEKMRYDAEVKAAAEAKAAEAKAAEEAKAAAAKKAQDALAFNPFAPAAQVAAVPTPTTTDSAARQAAIDRLLARVRSMKVAQLRQNLIMIAVNRGKRSPNGPPESTPRRPFDPPGPPPHVPPGPPQHAPPGPPR